MGVALPSVLVLLVCVSVADVDVPHKRYYCSKASQSCLPLVPGTASQPPPSEGLALKACEVVCAGGSLWPQPRGRSDVNRTLRGIDPCEVHFHWPVTDATPPRLGRLLENATAAFRDTLRRESGGPVPPPHCRAPAPSLVPLLIRLRVKAPTVRLTLATDEAYNLTVGPERCPCGAAEPCWDPGTNICSPRALAERARCGSGIACGAAPDAALMVAVVVAQTYFGARHALETLSQLLPYDESAGHFLLPLTARIEDSPNFAYRGLMIDTARQFLPVPLILDTIRAMSYAKLNTLHWHLSDTASFSVEVPRQPNVTRHGAYGPGLYYSTGDIARVVEHATALGVRVVPELDVPAHAWAGWQWGPAAGLGELVLCGSDWTGDRQVPWSTRGPEPPTGQLNIANPHVHRILADLYLDLVQAFGGPDLFHLGGDEVVVGDPDSISCWNSTTAALAGPNPIVQAIQTSLSHCCPGPPASPPPSQASHTASRTAPEAPAGPCCPDGPNSTRCCPGDITDKHSFYALWTNFTQRASDSLQAAYHALNLSQPSKVLQWGGAGTGGEPAIYNLFGYPKHHLKACPPEKFLVQVWDASGAKSPGSPSIAPALIKRGYDVVLSNSDFTYLDCGGSGWVAPGGYWCKPYLEWYTLYDYVPAVRDLWGLSRADMAHVKGAEVLIWGETADASNLMQKVWPRAAALAERLWTHPAGVSSEKHVDGRMQMHRHRLVDRGIAAEALQPLWCEQHGMACSLKGWKRQGVPQRPKRPRNMKKIAITD